MRFGADRAKSGRAPSSPVRRRPATRAGCSSTARSSPFEVERPGRRRASRARDGSLTAPMPATVRQINVAPGARVKRGDILIVLEAMKMELPVRAPGDGTVARGQLPRGELVQAGQELIELRAMSAMSAPRHGRRSRPARRAAERGGRDRHRRQDRVRRSADRGRTAGDRSVGVRQPEVGAADGGRRRGVRAASPAAGARVHRARAQPRRPRSRASRAA